MAARPTLRTTTHSLQLPVRRIQTQEPGLAGSRPFWPAYQPDPSYDQPGSKEQEAQALQPGAIARSRGCSNPGAVARSRGCSTHGSRWLPCNTATTLRCHIPRYRLSHRCSIPSRDRRYRLTIRCSSKALCLTHLNPACRTTTTRNHSGHRHPGPLHTPHRCKSRHQCRHLRRLRS